MVNLAYFYVEDGIVKFGSVALAALAAFDQAESFQFRDDDDTEAAAAFLGAVNSNQTLGVDINYRIRFEVQETGGVSSDNNTFALEFDHESAGFTAVTAATSLQWATSVHYAHADDTTQQIGDGTFITDNNGMVETAATNDGIVDFAGSDNAEFEYCFSIDSGQVANNDTIILRIVADKGTGNSRTQTATITVTAPTSGPPLGGLALMGIGR